MKATALHAHPCRYPPQELLSTDSCDQAWESLAESHRLSQLGIRKFLDRTETGLPAMIKFDPGFLLFK